MSHVISEIKHVGGLRMHVACAEVETFTDVPAAHGGLGQWPSPVVLMAEALACCAVTTACMGAQKMGIATDGFRAELTDIKFATDEDRVSAIALTMHLPAGMEPKMRQRLESFTLHGCTVGNTLKAEKNFTFVYDV